MGKSATQRIPHTSQTGTPRCTKSVYIRIVEMSHAVRTHKYYNMI